MKRTDTVLLADIGNTRFHIYDGTRVIHLSPKEAIARYKKKPMRYICVNKALLPTIASIDMWEDVSESIRLKGAYETMGADRKALCLSHDNGLFIDAGSAITVDVMRRGVYAGGWIWPGIEKMRKTYAAISPELDFEIDWDVSLLKPPATTKEQISYGIIASIKALVERHKGHLPIYVCGGDGMRIASLFKEATYDETLVFKGMSYALSMHEASNIEY